jgi:hypothetical protein
LAGDKFNDPRVDLPVGAITLYAVIAATVIDHDQFEIEVEAT